MALGVAADDLVLPERQTFGITLIHRGNPDVGAVLRIEDVNVAKISRVKRQLDLRAHAHSPPQFTEFWAIVFQPFQFDSVVEDNPLNAHPQHQV